MSSSEKPERELSVLHEEIGNALKDEYYEKFAELFRGLRLFELDNDGPVPLEVWSGIAQAVADASGCRVVLQSHLVETEKDDPDTERIIGYREVAVGDPFFFVR